MGETAGRAEHQPREMVLFGFCAEEECWGSAVCLGEIISA